MTLKEMQTAHNEWARRNFGPTPPYRALLGAMEELGELAHAVCLNAATEWRPVVGYERWYEVSDHGLVRRVARGKSTKPNRILKMRVGADGYHRVVLFTGSKKSRREHFVHSMVAEAFIGPRPAGFEVNHKDGVKSHNTPFNLEYVTRKENQEHAIRLGLCKPVHGSKHWRAKLTEQDVVAIRSAYQTGKFTYEDLAKKYSVDRSLIGLVVRNKIWVHEAVVRNFVVPTSLHAAVAALGKLAHAHLKEEQGIRGTTAKHEEDAKDAVADTVIYLIDYCNLRGWDFEALLMETWSRVSQRDWKKNPTTG
jgi:NTP pyrophosphatase (non-canonical NTP hydrolase)